MIDTGATLSLATKTLHEKGAKSIHALITHGKFYSFLCSPLPLLMTPCIFPAGLLSLTNMSMIETLPLDHLVVRLVSRLFCFEEMSFLQNLVASFLPR